jgi:hypothetical protein
VNLVAARMGQHASEASKRVEGRTYDRVQQNASAQDEGVPYSLPNILVRLLAGLLAACHGLGAAASGSSPLRYLLSQFPNTTSLPEGTLGRRDRVAKGRELHNGWDGARQRRGLGRG